MKKKSVSMFYHWYAVGQSNISLGVAMSFRCDGIFNHFIANLLLNAAVKKF